MVVVILLALILLFSLLSPNFLKPSNLFTILRQTAMVGILSVGGAIIMISGGIDLSIGVQMGFSGIIAALLMVNSGVTPVLACLAGFLDRKSVV